MNCIADLWDDILASGYDERTIFWLGSTIFLEVVFWAAIG